MNILLCGATGFVGRTLMRALQAEGHHVLPGVSHARGLPDEVVVDYTRDHASAVWLPRLAGVDAVINAVGVLRDTLRRPIQSIHALAPIALFDACAEAGVQRVVQISALGVTQGTSDYAGTKLAADRHLEQLARQGRLQPTIVRPSVVFGQGGSSTALFLNLARLPVRLLPRPVIEARIQPVAVGELAEAVAHLLRSGAASLPAWVEAVGPQPVTMAEFVTSLRRQAGRSAGWQWPLPDWVTELSASVGDRIPASPWCHTSLAMLATDNVAPPGPFAALLGREATSYDRLLASPAAAAV